MILNHPLDGELSEAASRFVGDALARSLGATNVLIFADRITVDVDGELSQDRFDEVIRNLMYVTKSINRKVLFENTVSHSYRDDPMPILEGSGDVIRTSAGMFSFQGTFWSVLQACRAYAFRIARRYEAIEQEYPVLWPVDLYKRINYFKEFPQQIILSAPLENDFDVRDNFAREHGKDCAYDSVSMSEGFADSTYGLQCAVCDICYYNLRESRGNPNTVYTTYNKVFRNERSATDSLDRLTTFSVRDIMFVGDRDFVLLHRQRMLDEAENLLRELDLESRIETADDPFFTNDAVVKSIFQSASELKHELLVKLSYSDSWVAVGSVNMHLDFFGQAFDIQLPDGSPAYSGCFGIGFERLAFALYCQYGPTVEGWPSAVRDALEL